MKKTNSTINGFSALLKFVEEAFKSLFVTEDNKDFKRLRDFICQ
jgi:hypothetical protein